MIKWDEVRRWLDMVAWVALGIVTGYAVGHWWPR